MGNDRSLLITRPLLTAVLFHHPFDEAMNELDFRYIRKGLLYIYGKGKSNEKFSFSFNFARINGNLYLDG